MTLLLLAFLGGLGALCRDLVDQHIRRYCTSDFPWGIFIVNCLGSFLLGLLIGISRNAVGLESWSFYLGFGFLGAFTTFSTWMYQSLEHLLADRKGMGVRIILSMTAFGLLAAAAGYGLGAMIL